MKKISFFLLSLLISIVSLAESYSTIAEVKALTSENIPVTLTSDAVISFVSSNHIILEDTTDAVKICNSNLAKEEGVNPAVKSHGSCFNVMNTEVEEIILENASIITEYDAENYSQTQSVMVGEEKLLVSYAGDDKLPQVAKVLKGYKASEVYYEYDENWNQIQMTRDVFVVTSIEVDNITISDFVATTEGSYKYVTYNEEKLRFQAPSGKTIPVMGTVTGYIYETASWSGTTLCFWVLEAEVTGYSNINEYKKAVGAGNTATKSAAILDPMLVSYVYANPRLGTATLFVKQGSYYYAAIRTTTTDKNGKAYAAGDSIKGVKGLLTAYGFDQANNDIITGTYIDINPMENTIEIISSGATTPDATSLYDLANLTGAYKSSAGSYEARYMTISAGELKAKDIDGIAEYWFFSDKGDSILVVAPTFEITEDMLGRKVLKAFTDVKNSGANVQLILTAESDIIESNIKFNSIAAIKAAGAAGSGITYELTTPALVTYIQENFEYNGDTYVNVPKNWLYVQDATGAMRVSLDTAATRLSTVAVGDSIVGVKGVFDSNDASVNVSVATAQHTVKNSNNPLIPTVITLKQLIEAQSAGTYNGMLVHFDSVYYVKSQIKDKWEIDGFSDIHYFIQGEDTLSYSEYKFNVGFGAAGYKFYATNHITAVVENGWQGGQYGFWPINQGAIENTEIASGKCGDNLFWRLTPDNILTIYGEGDMYDFAPYQQPWQQYILNITKVVFNGNATSIGSYAFADCHKTQTITFSDNIETIKFRAFSGCLNVNAIEIPASVTEIEEAAFEDCRSISELTFEEGSQLESIGSWAFYNNHALGFINLPESVREIGDAAFYGCNYVEEIVIPASVQRIGDNGFALCNQVKRMEVRATTPPAIEAKTFHQVSRNIEFIVPAEARDAYAEDEYWREFIQEVPTNVENTIECIEIYTTNGTLHVEGATDDYHILDAAGRLIYSGNATTLQLPRGIYLITMGGEVEKIVL